jgi:cobalt transporter subunit CbtB
MGISVLRLTLAERVAACAVCFAVGAALLFAVGFAHSTTLHNAAHDVRHTFVFPCH